VFPIKIFKKKKEKMGVGSELQFTANLHTTRPPAQSDSYQRLY